MEARGREGNKADGTIHAENWYSQSDDQPAKYAFPTPFDQDFYIIFNMAVGGTYDGNLNPDASALPAEMKVDYVRVYQFNELFQGIVDDPDVTPETIPTEAKDSIIDPGFTDVKRWSTTATPRT